MCAAARRITVVADREADIYAAFARRPARVELLIRAAHDRALADDGRLFARLDVAPVAGRAMLSLPARPGQAARATEVEARFMTADLKRPRNNLVEGLPDSVAVTLVDIRETSTPAGAKPVRMASAIGQAERKEVFFLERKNQRTFIHVSHGGHHRRATNSKSLFASFSSEKEDCLLK